ncbi:hypothetical protein MBH78_02755 [Oceanimonas sp. NS1]|nr:hypothetical protein [Oceanimonas sp. NS1]
MTTRLFVYGTLGPGRPNEHVLTAIGGSGKPPPSRERYARKAGGLPWVTPV